MSKPKVIVLHPKDWAISDYGKKSSLEIHHVSIGGKIPKKRSGKPTFDGYADIATIEGTSELYEKFKALQPDVFLWWIHVGVTPVLLRQLKSVSPETKFIMWFGNHRNKVVGNVTSVQGMLDMLLINSTESSQFKLYTKAGIKHVETLWDGFNPDEVPLKECTPEFDVFFGGESYLGESVYNPRLLFPGGPLRHEYITKMDDHFKLCVTSARKASWPFRTYPAVFHPKYTEVMRNAKITVNINHFPDFRKAYTRRTIRSIFARRCHVTHYIPGMEEDFENHKHLVWTHSADEALDVIRYYLDHETEREEIAWAGWQRACERFTFEHRLKDFERCVEKLIK